MHLFKATLFTFFMFSFHNLLTSQEIFSEKERDFDLLAPLSFTKPIPLNEILEGLSSVSLGLIEVDQFRGINFKFSANSLFNVKIDENYFLEEEKCEVESNYRLKITKEAIFFYIQGNDKKRTPRLIFSKKGSLQQAVIIDIIQGNLQIFEASYNDSKGIYNHINLVQKTIEEKIKIEELKKDFEKKIKQSIDNLEKDFLKHIKNLESSFSLKIKQEIEPTKSLFWAELENNKKSITSGIKSDYENHFFENNQKLQESYRKAELLETKINELETDLQEFKKNQETQQISFLFDERFQEFLISLYFKKESIKSYFKNGFLNKSTNLKLESSKIFLESKEEIQFIFDGELIYIKDLNEITDLTTYINNPENGFVSETETEFPIYLEITEVEVPQQDSARIKKVCKLVLLPKEPELLKNYFFLAYLSCIRDRSTLNEITLNEIGLKAGTTTNEPHILTLPLKHVQLKF
jgi:hypothetical protein